MSSAPAPAPITGAGLDYLQGRVLQGGRRLAYGDARLLDSAGKLLCHGTGSCLIVPR